MSGRVGISTRPKRRETEFRMSANEAMDVAAELLARAGFFIAWHSQISEARYYRLNGRFGTLRLATHAKRTRGEKMLDGPTVVAVTFPDGHKFAPHHVENHAANAVGLYLFRAKEV